MKAFTIASLVLIATARGFGTTYFNDGQIHNIDYAINDNVFVDYQSTDKKTIINLLPGGSIGSRGSNYGLTAYNNSTVNLVGGRVWGDFSVNDNTQITMTSGSVWGYFYANDTSRVSISGGGIIGDLRANDSSQLTLSYIDLPAGGWLDISNNSSVSISGGWLTDSEGNSLRNWSTSPIVIYGYNFALDGVPISTGTYTSAMFANYPRLTCNLNNGGGISLRPILSSNTSIILIPEPVTVLLLGLGGILLLGRNPR